MKVVNAIGVMILLGCAWALAAHSFGWDNANWPEAAIFGFVVYVGFTTTK